MSTIKTQPQQQQKMALRHEYAFTYTEPFSILDGAITLNPPYQIIALCVVPMILYVLCLYVIFPASRPRSREAILTCDKWRKRHNLFMCLYSLATLLLTLRELIIVNPDESRFFFSLDVAKDWTPMMCTPPTKLMQWVNGIFIVSKIVEWIDTAFIVWLKNDEAKAILKGPSGTGNNKKIDNTTGKSQKHEGLSFLHAYHHMTTLLAFLLVVNCAGAVKIGPLLNGACHFLMYLHYFRPLPRFLVPFITISQILQFFFVIFLWYAAVEHCPDFKQFYDKHPIEWWTPFFFTPVYLIFFIKYFIERYILGVTHDEKKNKNKKE